MNGKRLFYDGITTPKTYGRICRVTIFPVMFSRKEKHTAMTSAEDHQDTFPRTVMKMEVPHSHYKLSNEGIIFLPFSILVTTQRNEVSRVQCLISVK